MTERQWECECGCPYCRPTDEEVAEETLKMLAMEASVAAAHEELRIWLMTPARSEREQLEKEMEFTLMRLRNECESVFYGIAP